MCFSGTALPPYCRCARRSQCFDAGALLCLNATCTVLKENHAMPVPACRYVIVSSGSQKKVFGLSLEWQFVFTAAAVVVKSIR